MPGTHSPATTWHNTGTYVQTGEVITESVSKQLGEYAMDNVAYLTGGNTLSQVTQLSTVADLAALKAVGAAARRDQDYKILDSNKRLYQFDSASGATGDDYAVVTPTAGTGRWILVGAVPKTTTKRWVLSALQLTPDDTATLTWISATQRVTATGGGNGPLYGQFRDFNPGDVISEIECAGLRSAAAGPTLTADFYLVQCDDGGVAPTVTALGTLTLSAGVAEAQQSAAAPLPITIPAGSSHDMITVTVTITGGAPHTVELYWVALNGTRSYIVE